MEKKEKEIIARIIKDLKGSTQTDWTNGGMDVWAPWAKRMRDVIGVSTGVLETLIISKSEKCLDINQLGIAVGEFNKLDEEGRAAFKKIIDLDESKEG